MLSRVTVNDFQSHVNTELSLHPCFNIITGSNGTGKSAFLRALNSLFYNNMQGTSFIRVGSGANKPDFYSIDAYIKETGTCVRKIRGNGANKNSYVIDHNADMDGVSVYTGTAGLKNFERFDNVKTEVPKEVRKELNIYPVPIDSNKEINIQYCGQFDAPFMLMEPDSAKIKFLNTISGTYAVDLAIKESNLRYQKAKKAYDASEAEINKLDLESKEYSSKIETLETANKYLEDRIGELKKLEEEGKKLAALKKTSDELVEKYKQIRAMDQLMSKIVFTDISEKVSKLQKFFDLNQKYAYILKKTNAVQQLLDKYEELDLDRIIASVNKYVSYQNLYTQYTKLSQSYKDLIPVLNPISRILNMKLYAAICNLEKFMSLYKVYAILGDSYKENTKKLNEANETLSQKKAEYMALIAEAKICPVCKAPITGDSLEHIRREL